VTESSPRGKPPDSFGETAGAACDVARASKTRMRWAVALLTIGAAVAFVPGLAAGEWFLPGTLPVLDLEYRPSRYPPLPIIYVPASGPLAPMTPQVQLNVDSVASWSLVQLI